jgi:hypothetical protein
MCGANVRQIASLVTLKCASCWPLGLRAKKCLLLSGPWNVRHGGVSGLLWMKREERLSMFWKRVVAFLCSFERSSVLGTMSGYEDQLKIFFQGYQSLSIPFVFVQMYLYSHRRIARPWSHGPLMEFLSRLMWYENMPITGLGCLLDGNML